MPGMSPIAKATLRSLALWLPILGNSARHLAILHFPFSSSGSRPGWGDFLPAVGHDFFISNVLVVCLSLLCFKVRPSRTPHWKVRSISVGAWGKIKFFLVFWLNKIKGARNFYEVVDLWCFLVPNNIIECHRVNASGNKRVCFLSAYINLTFKEKQIDL